VRGKRAAAPVRHVRQRALQPAHGDQAGRERCRQLGQRGRGGWRAAVVRAVHALRQQQAVEHVLRATQRSAQRSDVSRAACCELSKRSAPAAPRQGPSVQRHGPGTTYAQQAAKRGLPGVAGGRAVSERGTSRASTFATQSPLCDVRRWHHGEAGARLHRLQAVRLERMTHALLRCAVPAGHGRVGRGWQCSAAQSVGKGGKEGLGCAWHGKSHCASRIATQLYHHGTVALTTRAPSGLELSPWASKTESLTSEPLGGLVPPAGLPQEQLF